VLVSGLGLHIVHEAGCPDENPVWCAAPHEPVPTYLHDQRVYWVRADLGVTAGLGNGWQLAASAPFDVRKLTIDYLTLDRDPYTPPAPLAIHHRNEVLDGPADGRLSFRRYAMLGRELTIGGGIGTTLPLGKTVVDPYRLTEQGLPHQHFQLGSGTFDPIASALVLLSGPRWGAMLAADMRAPVYTNRKGYRGPLSVAVSGGPAFRVTPKVQLFASVDGTYDSADRWHRVPYGGHVAVLASLGGLWAPTPSFALQAQARTTAVQAMLHDTGDEAVRQRLVVTVGATFTAPRKNESPMEAPAP
jgi:hypothetical protein